MSNYQIANVGEMGKLSQHIFKIEGTPLSIPGKIFLSNLVKLNSMEVSLNTALAGTGMDFFHKHKDHEEVYIFISGQGEMSIDDEIFQIKEGSIVSVKPEAKRSWWNTGDTELRYIVIQAPQDGIKASGIEDGEIVEGKVPWHQ